MGRVKNLLTQLVSPETIGLGSGSCPTDMVSKSFTVSCCKWALTVSGLSSGKKDSTLSSNDSFPSARAKPTAVAVKLLLREYRVCFKSARYGFHQPSAITFPWRSNIKL